MYVAEIERIAGIPIVLMDSIAAILPELRGAIVVTGSHGGRSAAEYALKYPLRAVIFNDAGIGKDEAGVVALAMLEDAGVAAAAVSHLSGRIGDASDMWENGAISRTNAPARVLGITARQAARQAARILASGR